ncbi:triple tyrosine motif-containing protein [Aquiflexum sp.]|uniref:sensor histidine kinase n=1 Tax=Aquiflexum sp. TaxID=1872584 RepID=UPI003594304E
MVHLGQKEGLIPNYVNDLAVDFLGRLQLATFGSGIISYEGQGFSPMISENMDKFPVIRKLKIIDNKHYFITMGELYRWDSKLDSLELIFKDDSPIINFYQLSPNRMLVSNYKGNFIAECLKDHYTVSELPITSPITQVIHLKNKITLAILGDGKIISDPFGNEPKSVFQANGGNAKVFDLDEFLVLIEDGHISYLDKEEFKILKKIASPPDALFTVFYQDDQSIWMGGNKGLFVLSQEGLRKINTAPKLTDMDISVITKTKDGIIWIGTYGHGLYKLYDDHVVQYSIDEAGLGQIYSVFRLKKSLDKFLITSNKGLYYFENDQVTHIQIPQNLKGGTLFSGVDEASGTLYIGGDGFILKKEYGRENYSAYFHEVFDKNMITSIVTWKEQIYVGSQRGIYLFDSDFNLLRDFNDGSEIKVRNVFQIHVINDNHIVYGDYFNLYETDLKSIREFELKGLKGKVISITTSGDQIFWLGTSSGILYLYDFKNHSIVREIYSKHGKNIYSVSIASDTSLVIGTEMGVERHYQDGSYLLYDERIRQHEVNYNSLSHLSNGDLLVGTVGGLIKISGEYSFTTKNPPFLKNFMVNNQEIPIHDYQIQKKPLLLSHSQNNLSFQVNLANFHDPKNTRIRFKLLGYEDDWGPIMNLGNVQYTNLPPGEYLIMANILYSQGDDGIYTLPIEIKIRKPFWLYPIFIIALTFAFVVMVYLGYIWFQRKTLRDNIKLQHLVDSRTKEINRINKNLEQQIHHRTLDLHNKNKELTKTIEQKKLFQSQVRLISSNTQDIVCLLSPDYSIKLISDSVEQMLGFTSDDLIKTQISQLLPDAHSSQRLSSYLTQLEEHSPPIILSLLHRITQKIVLVEILGKQVIYRNSHEIQGYVLNIRNVSEREFLKDELNTVYKNIHRDFHDEVGNKLAKIIALISVLKIELDNFPTSEETMGKIENTAKNLYHDTRDFIWSLDQENNRLEEFSIQLRDFGEMLFDGSAVQFKCNLDIHNNILLKPNMVRDLLLIMKEIMTNVLKHANATEAQLNIKQCGSHLLFLVKDNGIGIETNINHKGNGMKNIQYRALRCNGELILKSRKGSLVGIRIKA